MDGLISFFVELNLDWQLIGYMTAGLAMVAFTGWWQGWHTILTKRMRQGIAATLLLLLCNAAIIPFVMLSISALQEFYAYAGLPVVPPSFWEGLPFALVFVIAVLAFDFMDYVNHRLMHLRWLWPIHAVHHSDHDVNAFTTFRVHALEAFFMRLSYVIGLSWAGVLPEVAGAGLAFLTVHNMYVHMNIDIDHGPLNFLIASPRFHKWHHADLPKAYGKNLANLCPMWDMIFGTYYVPGPCNEPTSSEGVPHADVVSLMAYPAMEWARMAKGAVPAGFEQPAGEQAPST